MRLQDGLLGIFSWLLWKFTCKWLVWKDTCVHYYWYEVEKFASIVWGFLSCHAVIGSYPTFTLLGLFLLTFSLHSLCLLLFKPESYLHWAYLVHLCVISAIGSFLQANILSHDWMWIECECRLASSTDKMQNCQLKVHCPCLLSLIGFAMWSFITYPVMLLMFSVNYSFIPHFLNAHMPFLPDFFWAQLSANHVSSSLDSYTGFTYIGSG